MEREEDLTIGHFIRTIEDVPEGGTFVQGSQTPHLPVVGVRLEELTPWQVERSFIDEDIDLQ